LKRKTYDTDLCVIGGGMAGLCCSIAAARKGIKVVLVHDRHVLGGNASEEIRMCICGARGENNRETGIIEEIIMENYYQNKERKYPLWSSVLYEKGIKEENLTMLLNSSCMDAETEDGKIKSITAWQSNAETFHTVKAKYYADCSGDSILAELTGANYMYGREAKSEYNETIPPDIADKKTMGMSCLFQTRETDHKCEFTPPDWANIYETDDDLPFKDHTKVTNFWWIEVGGNGDCLHDVDKYRDELLKICYGVWDHIKNRGKHPEWDNWEIEWIGFLPGKRESRRYKGKYVVTQNDVEAEGKFDDVVAYAGWPMDDHFPEGFHHTTSLSTVFHPAPSPWGIPLRAMISENIENLVFAGRNISVTHAALSSSRVMATCSILGQAIGTAVSMAVKNNCNVENIDVKALQNTLLEDDCFIPNLTRKVSRLSQNAKCSADIVRNGKERCEKDLWIGKDEDFVEYTIDKPTDIKEVRLVFDSNLNRNYHNMPFNYPLVQERYVLPKTLITEYDLEFTMEDGTTKTIEVKENHQRLVKHFVDLTVTSVKFVPKKTNGAEEYRLFSFELR